MVREFSCQCETVRISGSANHAGFHARAVKLQARFKRRLAAKARRIRERLGHFKRAGRAKRLDAPTGFAPVFKRIGAAAEHFFQFGLQLIDSLAVWSKMINSEFIGVSDGNSFAVAFGAHIRNPFFKFSSLFGSAGCKRRHHSKNNQCKTYSVPLHISSALSIVLFIQLKQSISVFP